MLSTLENENAPPCSGRGKIPAFLHGVELATQRVGLDLGLDRRIARDLDQHLPIQPPDLLPAERGVEEVAGQLADRCGSSSPRSAINNPFLAALRHRRRHRHLPAAARSVCCGRAGFDCSELVGDRQSLLLGGGLSALGHEVTQDGFGLGLLHARDRHASIGEEAFEGRLDVEGFGGIDAQGELEELERSGSPPFGGDVLVEADLGRAPRACIDRSEASSTDTSIGSSSTNGGTRPGGP